MHDLTPRDSALLLVDLQQRLLPTIDRHEYVTRACEDLIDGLALLELPVVLTEQYRRLLGPTVDCLHERLPAVEPLPKMTFDCCGEPAILDALERTGRRQIIVAGIETHVCVLQTACSLARKGYGVFLAADACGSRKPEDHSLALELMRSRGVTVATVEMLVFQLLETAEGRAYRQFVKILKR
jgi:nicotinamidase-related amidase